MKKLLVRLDSRVVIKRGKFCENDFLFVLCSCLRIREQLGLEGPLKVI